ncbi:MAG TPA: HAD-IB family phosphatase [Elusimicrobiales bacterium]|nr:HAD-IB family phosphatase [Elusimicrobiales bacterium]
MKWAAVSDFDGTLTLEDVGDAILTEFGVFTAEDIERSYAPGQSVETWMRRGFARLSASRREIESFILRAMKPRRGLRAFSGFCSRRRIPFDIVSGGADIYARPLLRAWGVKARSSFGRARRRGRGWDVEYADLRGSTLPAFKESRVRHYKKSGRRVLFCGDAPSDLRAAALADKVYAAGRLRALCRARGIKFSTLTDLAAAADFMDRNS